MTGPEKLAYIIGMERMGAEDMLRNPDLIIQPDDAYDLRLLASGDEQAAEEEHAQRTRALMAKAIAEKQA